MLVEATISQGGGGGRSKGTYSTCSRVERVEAGV